MGMGNLASNWQDQSPRALAPEMPWTADNLEELAGELLANVAATGIAIVREDSEVAGTLVCVVSLGTCVPARAAQVDPGSGISGRCVRECRTQRCYDTRIDPRVERAVSERLGIRSLVVVPLIMGSRCVGLIEAVSDRPGHFDEDHAAVVERAAKKAAGILARQQNSSSSFSDQLPAHASESAQPMETTGFSLGFQDRPQHITDADSSRPETALQFDERHEDSRSRPSLWWWAGLPAALIAVLLVAYSFRRHTKDQIASIHRASTQSQPPSVPPLAQNGKTTTPVTDPAIQTDPPPPLARAEGARRGRITDQIELARAYMNGDGVTKSREKAASWYIIAGENGSATAKRRSIEVTHEMTLAQIAQIRFDVGKMYMDGVGTGKDYVTAYKWFELAKAAGNRRAQGEEEILSTRMQPIQVQDGRQRASIWLESHLGKTRHKR